MVCVNDANQDILVVSEKGYGKRSSLDDYRVTNRGGKGVKTINITDKTGHLIAILGVQTELDFMIINKSGIAIRLRVEDLRVMGRATQGVRLINLRGNDAIAAVCSVEKDEEDDAVIDAQGIENVDLTPDNNGDQATDTNTEATETE
jgi:DNA gyrase subunit A